MWYIVDKGDGAPNAKEDRMDRTDQLEHFAQEFPFPWSIDPSSPAEEACRRLEAETNRALVSFETFVERFREQLSLREGAEEDVTASTLVS